jgi:type IV secretory pathway TrbD component
MSVVSTWLAFMGFGVGIFLVGLVWVRKERRERERSLSRPRKYESSVHPGTDLVDTNRQGL